MKMPGVNISFTEKAGTAIERGERGIVAMIMKGTVPSKNPFEITGISDIPGTVSAKNRQQIMNVLKGYVTIPRKLVVYVLPASAEDYTQAREALEIENWNYLVAPSCETDHETETLAAWIGTLRGEGKMVKAVLPNYAADKEYIINYTTEQVVDENGATYTAEEFCGRIAGIIAGTPLTISCTYAPLPEIVDCSRLKRPEMDAKVAAGEIFVYHDGEKVKVARGVTSFTTETEEKKKQFRKIKIVDAMDMITDDIRKTIEDSYIGKYANSYDNKCVILSAVNNYFSNLSRDGILSGFSAGIDMDANRSYLEGRGVKTADMSEDEIKQADTGDEVFLMANIRILDAIEEVTIPIAI